ncbi:MAG: Gfo/Idh/MocA family oxidoreductase, partial [bacterium]|nr:Gfo/Idh/MocA family oxidoreductase [bacterium]
MSQEVKLAVIGLGRIGVMHAFHAAEIARETEGCEFVAAVDPVPERAAQVAADYGVKAFSTIEELLDSGVSTASLVATPTELHQQNAQTLVDARQRVLLEKPMTDSVASDREFAKKLDKTAPNALMLAFQRRFDAPLQYAKKLMDDGAIGRVFKIYSALEDSNPLPDGYSSPGILEDMSVHNVDEILWLCGRMPAAAVSVGNRVYSHRLTSADENFDDGFIYLWFDDEMVAQVQVTRNHVSGYRVETIIFGEQGQIHIGQFDMKPREIAVEVYGRDKPIDRKVFAMPEYGRPMPEFVDRFGPAYRAEAAEFVERCRTGKPFSVNHTDGLRAMEVIDAASRAPVT